MVLMRCTSYLNGSGYYLTLNPKLAYELYSSSDAGGPMISGICQLHQATGDDIPDGDEITTQPVNPSIGTAPADRFNLPPQTKILIGPGFDRVFLRADATNGQVAVRVVNP